MEKIGWEDCRTWRELFEWLCSRAGYEGNVLLASAYIEADGSGGRDEHGAIQKNLRNWRSGRHLPLRRHVVILARVLELDENPALRKRWYELYRSARGDTAEPDKGVTVEHAQPSVVPRRSKALQSRRWAVPLACMGIACAGGTYAYQSWQFQQLPLIGYDARVRMEVGESRLIHGDRTECNLPPPTYAEIVYRVPTSRLGHFSDGGIARKMDNACGRVLAVRAVRFTANKAGTEEIDLLGDFMKLEIGDVISPSN